MKPTKSQRKKTKIQSRLNTCTGSHSQCGEMRSQMDTERKDAVPRRHVTLTGSRGRLSGPVSPDCTDLFLFPRPHEYLSSSVVKTNLMRYRRSRLPSFFEEFTASSHCLLVMQTGQLFNSCLLPWKSETFSHYLLSRPAGSPAISISKANTLFNQVAMLTMNRVLKSTSNCSLSKRALFKLHLHFL